MRLFLVARYERWVRFGDAHHKRQATSRDPPNLVLHLLRKCNGWSVFADEKKPRIAVYMITIETAVSDAWPGADDYWQNIVTTSAIAAIQRTLFAGIVANDMQSEISVQLSDDVMVQDLNRKWRGKDMPTNVLSFPMMDRADVQSLTQDIENGDKSDVAHEILPEVFIGDIILAYGVCAREAAEKNIAFSDHMQHLVVHGTLHLLGYDHEHENDANMMEALEIEVLASLGIANPYIVLESAS